MRYHTTALIFLVWTGLCSAQTATNDQETIRLLVQQVKDLQERVKVLESERRLGAPASSSAIEPTQPDLASAEPPSLPHELHELHGVQWRGFGEVDYKVLDQRKAELGTFGFVPGSHGNFYTGDFDLLLTSRINDKAGVLAEMVFGEEEAQTFSVDLERALFKYDHNDHLKMSFGRYHTGIGYYNIAFHSGSWLQTAADRPLIMEYATDGGLLPTQAVGISVTGTIPSGGVGLNYVAEYGSSDTIRPDINGQEEDDENNSNHFSFGLFARPAVLPGLRIGGSYYHDRISDLAAGTDVRLGQGIGNVHVVYTGHGIESLNEGFLIRHDYGNSRVFNTAAFYSQISKRWGRVRPFFRYQYINANEKSIFEDVGLRHGPSLGARFEFNDNIAFKAQLDHTLRKGLSDLNGAHLQLAFTF
jgi:hypothetical protein